MRLPLRNAFALTAVVLETIARNLRPLVKAFVLSTVITLLLWFRDYLPYTTINSGYTRQAVSLIGMSVSHAVALVSIIRFLVLEEEPPLDPRKIQWRAVVLITLVAMPFWLLVRAIADFGIFIQVYYGTNTFEEIPPDYYWLYAIFSIYSFAVHSLALPLIYPLFGPIAISQRLDLTSAWRPLRHSLPSLVFFAALLIAATWMAAAVLQTIGGYIFLAVTDTIQGQQIDSNSLRQSLIFLVGLPSSFLFTVVPAVAVARLTLGLYGRTSTASASASRAPH